MVQINYRDREITAKIVYYGPALSGKTTNLQVIHECINYSSPTQFYSLNTKNDRTLFFDLLPINLGKINNFNIKIQVYTVPGQVQYNSTRKVVLAGCDAIVFVADSQKAEAEANLFSITNMKSNLRANGLLLEQIPWVLQYNKRDLKNIMSIDEMEQALNKSGDIKSFESVAIDGTGVFDTFIEISNMMLESIMTKYRMIKTDKELVAVKDTVSTTLNDIIKKYTDGKAKPAEEIAPEAAQPQMNIPESPEPLVDRSQSGTAIQVGDEVGVDVTESTQPIQEEQRNTAEYDMETTLPDSAYEQTGEHPALHSEQPTQYVNPEEMAESQRRVTKFQLGQSPSIEGQEGPVEQEYLSNEQLVETAVQANMRITELTNKLAESEKQLEAKLQEIQLLSEIGKALTSELNMDKLLEMIINAAVDRLNVKYASINIFDEKKNYMEPRKLHNLTDDPIVTILRDKLITFLDGIVKRGKMAVITSTENKSLANALERFDNYTSFISVSLKYKNNLRGVLNLYYKENETYQKEDLRFVIMLATHAAIAIENALLYNDLNKAKHYLDNIINNAGDAIMTLSPVGRVLTWNETAREVFGYINEEVIGKNIDIILDKENKEKIDNLVKQVFSGNIIKNQPIEFKGKSGNSISTFITLSPIKEEDDKIVSCSALIRETGEAAGKAVGVDTSDNFLFNLVAEVEPQIEKAKEKMASAAEKLKEAINADKSNSFQLASAALDETARVIDSALKLKKMKSVTPPIGEKIEEINVNDLLMSVIYMRQQELDAKKISLDVPGNMPDIRFPQSDLTQIFSTIISKSINTIENLNSPSINIGYKDENDLYTFFVKSSPAPPAEIKSDSFFNPDHSVQDGGGGINIALAKDIIEKFNGKIWLESKPGEHLTVYISIPKF